MGKSDFAIESS